MADHAAGPRRTLSITNGASTELPSRASVTARPAVAAIDEQVATALRTTNHVAAAAGTRPLFCGATCCRTLAATADAPARAFTIVDAARAIVICAANAAGAARRVVLASGRAFVFITAKLPRRTVVVLRQAIDTAPIIQAVATCTAWTLTCVTPLTTAAARAAVAEDIRGLATSSIANGLGRPAFPAAGTVAGTGASTRGRGRVLDVLPLVGRVRRTCRSNQQ